MEPICTCHSIEFIPIDEQPRDFVSALSPTDRATLLAACEEVAAGFADGRPHGSRTVLIGSSTLSGLFMLRVVWPGSPKPQLRLICVRNGPRVLIARGFVQEEPHFPLDEIEQAEQVIRRVQEAGHERETGEGR